jgi:Tfp pilus assembly protein PilO
MKLERSSSNKLIIAMVAIAVLSIAFWMMLLSPKREEADKLGKQVEKLEASLAAHETEVAEALQARDEFPRNYEQLIVLGKAVPGDDDTATLIVQLNRIADSADVSFREMQLAASVGEEVPPPAPEEGSGTEGNASPTEVAASTLPLGASVGPAGLAVMPYDLTFEGDFFKIADFIKGLDSLVKTENAKVSVNGRLFTINGFSFEPAPGKPFPFLKASFSITTYLTPPGEGVVAGATPTGPNEATPASATIGATP